MIGGPVRSRLGVEAVAVDPILLNFVADDSFGGVEQFGCPFSATARCFQGINNYVALKRLNCRFEGETSDRARTFCCLQRGWEVMPVNNVGLTNQHRPLDDVFQFPNIAGPVITGKHVNRRRRDAPDAFVVFARELFEKVIGE